MPDVKVVAIQEADAAALWTHADWHSRCCGALLLPAATVACLAAAPSAFGVAAVELDDAVMVRRSTCCPGPAADSWPHTATAGGGAKQPAERETHGDKPGMRASILSL